MPSGTFVVPPPLVSDPDALHAGTLSSHQPSCTSHVLSSYYHNQASSISTRCHEAPDPGCQPSIPPSEPSQRQRRNPYTSGFQPHSRYISSPQMETYPALRTKQTKTILYPPTWTRHLAAQHKVLAGTQLTPLPLILHRHDILHGLIELHRQLQVPLRWKQRLSRLPRRC